MAEACGAAPSLGISSEEFEQYQRQFIEERSEKYALLEKVRKLEQDLARFSIPEKSMERDFDKIIKDKFQKPFQTLLSRARKESESSDLIVQHEQEHEALQKRLHSQEDDFQRQNILLMQELQHLTLQNDELERKLKSPRHQESIDAARREESEFKIRSLEAELMVFRSVVPNAGLTELEDRYSTDVERLTVDLTPLSEEIRTLKLLFESNRQSYETSLSDQERTTAGLLRDLENKQTTVQQLLAEKDQLQRVNKDVVAAAATEKEKHFAGWRLDKSKLLEENRELRQAVDEERVISKTRAEDVERQMKDLLEQMDSTGHQTKRDSEELLMEHKIQIASLLLEVEVLRGRSGALEQSESDYRELVITLRAEQSKLTAEESEMARLAEMRKATIDDLTTHLNALSQLHQDEIGQFQEAAKKSNDLLTNQLQEASTDVVKVLPLERELSALRIKLAVSESEQVTTANELVQKSSRMELLQSSLAQEISNGCEQLEELRVESYRNDLALREEIKNISSERDEQVDKLLHSTVDLEQRLRDCVEDIKIMERKNAGVIRDLQKQLQSAKKHVEKLQNKLNELLRDGTVKLKLPDSDASDFTERDETGSVSSWSFVSPKNNMLGKIPNPDGSSNGSNTETETGMANSMTEREVHELVTRITKLQQEKSSLAERVSMLETGNAAMAQDLISKSAVIDRYLQVTPVLGHHGQAFKDADAAFSLRSLIDRLGRDKTMDVETQKNLRHLLEETLTKNVHLQKNMELLTEELDRLRGSSPPRQ